MPEVGSRLRLAADGSWFQVMDRPTVKIPRRRRLQKLLVALAKCYSETPGLPVEVAKIHQAVWPDKPLMRYCDLLNQCRVAVCTLRKLGLELIKTDYYGYRLHISTKLTLVPGAGTSS